MGRTSTRGEEHMWPVMADNPVVVGAGSGIFAIVLGLPWTLLTTSFVSETSAAFTWLLVASGMFVNALMLLWLCRWSAAAHRVDGRTMLPG